MAVKIKWDNSAFEEIRRGAAGEMVAEMAESIAAAANDPMIVAASGPGKRRDRGAVIALLGARDGNNILRHLDAGRR